MNPNLILSGGYDGLIKMYDVREQAVVCSLEHGSPIESALFLPSGSVFITAGTILLLLISLYLNINQS